MSFSPILESKMKNIPILTIKNTNNAILQYKHSIFFNEVNHKCKPLMSSKDRY